MEFGISTFITDDGIRPDVLGKALEERGFESLFIAEHSHIPVSRESPWPRGGELPAKYYRTLDPFVALASAASVTSNLSVGTGVALVVQRDVIHTAKEVASLDLVSGGRFLFGVGVGWNREEMRDHGTNPRTRGALLNEQLAALKALWTEERAEFHGEFVDFEPTYLWPKPAQRPHPPVYVGGESEAALERLAAHGDAWLPRAATGPDEIRRVRDWLADRGRADVTFTMFSVEPDPAKLAGYEEAGVRGVTLNLPTLPESDTLATLDEYAKVVNTHRGG